MSQSLFLFDDTEARNWLPFTLTRPAGEMRYGAMTLRERAERVLGAACAGHLAAPHLARYEEAGAPGVVPAGGVPENEDVVFLSARAALDWQPIATGPEAHLIAVDGTVCGWYAPAGSERPDETFLDDPDSAAPDLPVRELEGTLLRRVWDIMAGSAEQVSRDIAALNPGPSRISPPVRVDTIGTQLLVRHPGAVVEPGVVLDLSRGPIWLERGAVICAFTRLAGPSHVASGTTILGGSVDAVSVGPRCKIRGEVEESIFLGYANKAHDGFLGHAIVGMWANLGAFTTNSDLKNNYSTVRVWTPSGPEDTGSMKIGSFIGDHVKTAIGTTLNTGTVIGAGANVFGERTESVVPPFAWGGDETHRLDRFLETAERVMARRDVTLTDDQRAMLEAAWKHAHDQGWTG